MGGTSGRSQRKVSGRTSSKIGQMEILSIIKLRCGVLRTPPLPPSFTPERTESIDRIQPTTLHCTALLSRCTGSLAFQVAVGEPPHNERRPAASSIPLGPRRLMPVLRCVFPSCSRRGGQATRRRGHVCSPLHLAAHPERNAPRSGHKTHAYLEKQDPKRQRLMGMGSK